MNHMGAFSAVAVCVDPHERRPDRRERDGVIRPVPCALSDRDSTWRRRSKPHTVAARERTGRRRAATRAGGRRRIELNSVSIAGCRQSRLAATCPAAAARRSSSACSRGRLGGVVGVVARRHFPGRVRSQHTLAGKRVAAPSASTRSSGSRSLARAPRRRRADGRADVAEARPNVAGDIGDPLVACSSPSAP